MGITGAGTIYKLGEIISTYPYNPNPQYDSITQLASQSQIFLKSQDLQLTAPTVQYPLCGYNTNYNFNCDHL